MLAKQGIGFLVKIFDSCRRERERLSSSGHDKQLSLYLSLCPSRSHHTTKTTVTLSQVRGRFILAIGRTEPTHCTIIEVSPAWLTLTPPSHLPSPLFHLSPSLTVCLSYPSITAVLFFFFLLLLLPLLSILFLSAPIFVILSFSLSLARIFLLFCVCVSFTFVFPIHHCDSRMHTLIL